MWTVWSNYFTIDLKWAVIYKILKSNRTLQMVRMYTVHCIEWFWNAIQTFVHSQDGKPVHTRFHDRLMFRVDFKVISLNFQFVLETHFHIKLFKWNEFQSHKLLLFINEQIRIFSVAQYRKTSLNFDACSKKSIINTSHYCLSVSESKLFLFGVASTSGKQHLFHIPNEIRI